MLAVLLGPRAPRARVPSVGQPNLHWNCWLAEVMSAQYPECQDVPHFTQSIAVVVARLTFRAQPPHTPALDITGRLVHWLWWHKGWTHTVSRRLPPVSSVGTGQCINQPVTSEYLS